MSMRGRSAVEPFEVLPRRGYGKANGVPAITTYEQEVFMIQANDPTMRFSPDHTYVKVKDEEALIGLTYFGQEHTSRVSQVEFPQIGMILARGQPFVTIEAIKATVELPMPVTGEVLAINEALRNDPWLINTDPYGQGWLIRVRLEDPTQLDQLLDEAAYQASAVWEPEHPW